MLYKNTHLQPYMQVSEHFLYTHILQYSIKHYKHWLYLKNAHYYHK